MKNLNALREEEMSTLRNLFATLQSKRIPRDEPRRMENTAPAAKHRRMVISLPTANSEAGNKRGLSEIVAAMENNGGSPTCVMADRHKVLVNRFLCFGPESLTERRVRSYPFLAKGTYRPGLEEVQETHHMRNKRGIVMNRNHLPYCSKRRI